MKYADTMTHVMANFDQNLKMASLKNDKMEIRIMVAIENNKIGDVSLS